MKLTILESDDHEGLEIIVKCKMLNDEVIKVLTSLRSLERKVLGTKDGKVYLLLPNDIYYFESVDKKTFAYTEKSVYEVSLRLYQIEELFGDVNFFRATKASILNLDRLQSISPRIGGRLEVKMENGENLLVSRQYVPVLKAKLGF
ncbi:LytTR family transcriptional regulator DNA-binding domain-containing protein [Fictibacillus sp. 5RED26]|jgi:DNA-binding LytR/AlgR family response regulator|uniref:LytTR family DNA-binding domain-containing protein n=1 Tax=unclassified Fictibacillus TaxID=2644029 RepID=UPI0018CDD1BA|nr:MULTISPECIES: LytTR family DNA-binding domain-containing protein [unclassified Fictibacillus]MBH0158146.1 LytTR family transcriptional regulator DNA-binding domain-containing protein [Fictibacillus sp. 5RED26]MBH0167030.1 LytTR family transcriptional regulator DNA-binding domain-containing protein [Fictibacillus sp. 7GRE50]MBH0174874.1 LytTR family transcriptional regulator DNA-binding domain-containing protein [Fictibacillus sp. 23RED33]